MSAFILWLLMRFYPSAMQQIKWKACMDVGRDLYIIDSVSESAQERIEQYCNVEFK